MKLVVRCILQSTTGINLVGRSENYHSSDGRYLTVSCFSSDGTSKVKKFNPKLFRKAQRELYILYVLRSYDVQFLRKA